MKTNKMKKTIFTSISVLALVLLTAIFCISLHAQTIIIGDMNNDSVVNEDDAAYLLRHVLLPSKYPIDQSGDLNGDGKVDVDDALYLSKHITSPDEYPLTCHHDFGEWTQTKAPTCTEMGEEKRICNNCGQVETRDVAALGHNEVSHAAKAPTCTEKGWDAYVTCSRCDYTTYVEKLALGHNEVSHAAKAPTCTEIGWDAYVTCSRCDYTTYAERPALGHEYVDGVCKNCGQEIQPSEGLEYTLNSDRKSYYVSGIGTCTDTDIVIPSTYNRKPVTSIGNYAFRVCSKLTSITIGKSVMSIGNYAFSSCSSLTSIEIPDSVTSIGDSAFIGCSSLTSITIPDSVTSISGSAFSGCSSLTSITVVSGNPVYHSAGNCLIETSSRTLVAGCKNSIIPNDGSVTSIGGLAFEYCSSLTSVTIGNSVTSIGNSAFYGCSSLTSITIPDSVTSIGNGAFYHCSSLTSVTIGNSVTSIGHYVFSNCSSLTSITVVSGNPVYHSAGNCLIETSSRTLVAGCKNSIIPNDGSVTSIGNYAFRECSSLTSITIPYSVTSIGYEAFWRCSSLTSITIPDSVTSIGSGAFSDCTGLTSITIPDSVTSIGSGAFGACYKLVEVYNLSSLNITKGSSGNGDVGYYALVVHTSADEPANVFADENGYIFYENGDTCYLLGYKGTDTALTLPENCNGKNYGIYEFAFSGCSKLTSITIGKSVMSIGLYAFSDCSGLTSITIGNGVTSIGQSAFYYCSSLTSIIIGNGVTSIGYGAFQGCSSLESITVVSGNTVYHSANNCLIKTSSKTLIAGCKNSIIPNDGTVTSIGERAFSGCSKLTSITIGKSIMSIGNYAFSGCSSLTSIEIPDSVTSIGWTAFSGCSSLMSVKIGKSVTSIGQYAFSNCSSLMSITIPDSVTSIGPEAFYYCRSLTSINFNGTKAQWNAISKGSMWNYNTGSYTIYCTDGTISK